MSKFKTQVGTFCGAEVRKTSFTITEVMYFDIYYYYIVLCTNEIDLLIGAAYDGVRRRAGEGAGAPAGRGLQRPRRPVGRARQRPRPDKFSSRLRRLREGCSVQFKEN